MRKLMIFGTMLLVSACAASTQPPVTVKGADVDLMTIAGKWYGVYRGVQSGRKGTIHFELFRGTRMAEGKVIMNSDRPELARTLQIKFVNVGGQMVQGKIGPYEDPGKKCQVETVFRGTVKGNRISGTFTTKVIGRPISQQGRWSVVRKEN